MDHQEGENAVLEVHSQVRSGTPKECEASACDGQEHGVSFWKGMIEKGIQNILPAFEIGDDDVMPLGFKKINCHMVFDVKLGLVHKARFVAGGHQTDPLKD
jgi:hypothetical protein